MLFQSFGIFWVHHEEREGHEGFGFFLIFYFPLFVLKLFFLRELRTTMLRNFRGLRKFSIRGINHKERIEHKKDNCSFLRPLCSLRLNLSFTLVAAMPRWVLRGDASPQETQKSFTVKSEKVPKIQNSKMALPLRKVK